MVTVLTSSEATGSLGIEFWPVKHKGNSAEKALGRALNMVGVGVLNMVAMSGSKAFILRL